MNDLMALAERIAREAHRGQVDKSGVDYIEHPARVAASVDGDAAKAIAWLHDVLEDTSVTFEQLLMDGIPYWIACAVDTLSRKSNETYREFIARIGDSGPIVIAVKLADLRDNLRPGCPADMAEKRYKPAIATLTAALQALHEESTHG
jgi:(p)ppGpp synthase/HD superfamily hydrolase